MRFQHTESMEEIKIRLHISNLAPDFGVLLKPRIRCAGRICHGPQFTLDRFGFVDVRAGEFDDLGHAKTS